MKNGFRVKQRDASQTIIINDSADTEQNEEVKDAEQTQSDSSKD
ncbi:MAG: hypothetical protein AB9919_06925 [Geobacteraceae bacterium]